MIVFEFFYDKMEVFGPKMDDMARYLEMEEDLEMEEEEEEEEGEEKEEEEEVSLFIVLFLSLCFCLPKCLVCDASSLRYMHSLARSSWPSVSATTPDCRRGRTMRRVWLPSLWLP